jgi:hypothetical protein
MSSTGHTNPLRFYNIETAIAALWLPAFIIKKMVD